jgi:hypothetical protein
LPLQYQVENASSSCRIQSRHPRRTTCVTLSVSKHPFQVRVSACQAPQRAGSSDAGEFSSRPGHPDGGVGQESHLPHHQPGGCPARILMTRRNKTRSRPSSLRDTRNGALTHTLRIALTPAQYLTARPPSSACLPAARRSSAETDSFPRSNDDVYACYRARACATRGCRLCRLGRRLRRPPVHGVQRPMRRCGWNGVCCVRAVLRFQQDVRPGPQVGLGPLLRQQAR